MSKTKLVFSQTAVEERPHPAHSRAAASHSDITYRCVPFWSWNERLEPSEVRRQMRAFAAAGWGGVFLHARPGLTTSFLGEEWFAAVAVAIDEAARSGIGIWLYDEDGWPSGTCGSAVPAADASFRIKVLIARRSGDAAPPGAAAIGAAKAGLQVYAWTAPGGDQRYHGWCYTDVLHRPAIAKFIELAYEPYYARFSEHFGKTIVGAFFDEPRVVEHFGLLPQGPVVFSASMQQRFRERFGYECDEHLHLLFREGPGAAEFRLRYYSVATELYERNFVGQIAQWCEEHDIVLTGHMMWEESLFRQQLNGVACMPPYRPMHIPGVDHLQRQVSERITLIQCRSVANQFGRRRVMSELYAAAGQSLSFAERLWIASQQLALGANLFVPHLALYTLCGTRKLDHPPNLSLQQPWWPAEHVLENRLARLCEALSSGDPVIDCAVLHPSQSAAALWKGRVEKQSPAAIVRRQETTAASPESAAAIDALDTALKTVVEHLLRSQRTLDFIDETILADSGGVDGAALRVGKMRYGAVILPSLYTLAGSTLACLQEFEAAGGVILRCGEGPYLLDGVPSDRLSQWLQRHPQMPVEAIPQALAKHRRPAAFFEPAAQRDILVHLRALPNGDTIAFLANLETKPCQGSWSFAGRFRSALCLDADTGVETPLQCQAADGALRAELEIPAGGCLLLRLTTSQAHLPPVTLVEPRTVSLQAEVVQRLDDNALLLDRATWRLRDGGWSAQALPLRDLSRYLVNQNYAGPLSLRLVFESDIASTARLLLVAENVADWEVLVNRQRLKVQHAPASALPAVVDFRWLPLEIAPYLRRGSNCIELITSDFARLRDTALEPLMLFGDFDVAAGQAITAGAKSSTPQPIIMHRIPAEGLRLAPSQAYRPGNLTLTGLPFYAGRLLYRFTLPLLPQATRYFLRLRQLDAAVASVTAGGIELGHIHSAPYQLDITRAVAEGRTQIELTLYGTLRNLLGPHHLPAGEPTWVSPAEFTAQLRPDKFESWARGDFAPSNWTDGYVVVSFGDVGEVSIVALGS